MKTKDYKNNFVGFQFSMTGRERRSSKQLVVEETSEPIIHRSSSYKK